MIQDADPVDDLSILNRALMERYTGDDPRFCTAVAGRVRTSGGHLRVRLASGGHPPRWSCAAAARPSI